MSFIFGRLGVTGMRSGEDDEITSVAINLEPKLPNEFGHSNEVYTAIAHLKDGGKYYLFEEEFKKNVEVPIFKFAFAHLVGEKMQDPNVKSIVVLAEQDGFKVITIGR